MSESVLSDNLLGLMKKNKVTIAELSYATGIAEITINKLRNGQNNNPTISTLMQIANFFNTNVNELLGNNIKTLTVLNEDGTELAQKLPINELQNNAEFAEYFELHSDELNGNKEDELNDIRNRQLILTDMGVKTTINFKTLYYCIY